jgi:hypothetical protein
LESWRMKEEEEEKEEEEATGKLGKDRCLGL